MKPHLNYTELAWCPPSRLRPPPDWFGLSSLRADTSHSGKICGVKCSADIFVLFLCILCTDWWVVPSSRAGAVIGLVRPPPGVVSVGVIRSEQQLGRRRWRWQMEQLWSFFAFLNQWQMDSKQDSLNASAKQCTVHTRHTLKTARILGSWFIDIKKETDWQGRAHKGC